MQNVSTPLTPFTFRRRESLLMQWASLSYENSSPLNAIQSQVDGLVGSFMHQATDWRSLAAMVTGGMAYRLGRIGVMGFGSGNGIRAVSVGLGLTAEVSAFEMTHRGLATLSRRGGPVWPPAPGSTIGGHPRGGAPTNHGEHNLWRWDGQGGIRQGLLQSFITFGTLKGAGRLASGENLVVQHLMQDSAMVLGHQVSGSLDITSEPHGTLAEQFLHAEAVNLQIGAGMALGYRVAPGMHALERGLDLSIHRTDVGAAPRGRPQLDSMTGTHTLSGTGRGVPLPHGFKPALALSTRLSQGPRDHILSMIQYEEGVHGPAGGSLAPSENIRTPPRGGVMVRTSEGWIQIGVPMWTNKDAYQIYLEGGGAKNDQAVAERIPTVYILDPDYVPKTDGLLPADFIQYMHFPTQETTFTLVAPDRTAARKLKSFLDLSYLGPAHRELSRQVKREYPPGALGIPNMAEENRGFPASKPEALRRIRYFGLRGVVNLGEVQIRKLEPLVYEIRDPQGIRRIDLKDYPLSSPSVGEGPIAAEVEGIRRQVLEEGRPGVWPIGTAHGFSPHEETSGFMIWNGGKMVLVDPPSSTLEYLRNHRIPLSSIDGVILSHGHTDHYGNAVPQLLQALPRLNLYTSPTILRMLQRQYRLALGDREGGLQDWNFIPLRPQHFTSILGLHFFPDYSFHPVPALGFEIYDRPDARNGRLVLLFTGDTFADPVNIWKYLGRGLQEEKRVMTVDRALRILRHIDFLYSTRGQIPPPVMLIEGGLPPIHTPPLTTREILDRAERDGIDTSRVQVYHLSNKEAEEAKVPKWRAGHEGFIDLSDYFQP